LSQFQYLSKDERAINEVYFGNAVMAKKTSVGSNSKAMHEEEVSDDDVYPEEAAEAGESTPLISSTRSPSLMAGHMSSSGLSTNTCSSAITPRQSNVTAVDDSRSMPPRVPSMSSTTSSSQYKTKNGGGSKNLRLPSRRQSSDISSRNVSFNGDDQQSSSNSSSRHNNGNQQQQQQQLVHSPLRRSRITTSTTLVILVLGLSLAICTLFQYFMIGPTSFSLPPDLDVKNNNDGDGNIIGNDDNDAGRQQGGKEAGGHHAHQVNDNDVLFDEFGRIIIEDYDALPPFSEILPGVAGIYGKPLWVFYVNRGQAISSFGVKSKDYPIMEFYSANNAYQNTAVLGFRTFYKGRRNDGNVLLGKKNHEFFVEAFDTSRTRFDSLKKKKNSDEKEESMLPVRRMFIGANDVSIQEVDRVNKIETNVTYFSLPEEDFGAFVKRTTITNLASSDNDELHLSVLDGLSRIQPVGGKLELMLKMIGRTLQGFMQVHHAEGSRSLPFFRMSEAANDNAAVVLEEGGHFVISYIENEEKDLLPIVYDTNKVFGDDTSLLHPLGLYEKSIKDILREKQYGLARTSSAFAAVEDVTIFPGQSITITTFYGRADSIDDLPIIARKVAHGGWAQYKLSRARALIQQITSGAETVTANHLFDKHVEQMALDNALMGGVPILLGEVDDDAHSQNADDDERIKVFHLFSRRGDLERDYNEVSYY
jgi:hypothetical protein